MESGKKRISTSKKYDAAFILNAMLWLVFVLQAAAVVYFNLFELKCHMGFDSSWMILKTFLINKEHAFFRGPWIEQNNLDLDTSLLPATLLYAITGKIYLSYALGNLIIFVPIILSFHSILKKLNLGTASRLFALNMLISPYLVTGYNLINLGYAECFIWGPAYYNLRILTILLTINEYINIKKHGELGILSIVTLALYFFSGISCGVFLLVIFIFPCLVFVVLKTLLKNDIKVLTRKESVYFYLITGAALVGKEFASKVLGIRIIDASRTWTTLESFFNNIQAPFLGLMKLVGALPTKDKVEILSAKGIMQLFPLFIFAVVVLSVVFTCIYIKKNIAKDERCETLSLLITVVAVNYASLSLFNVVYGSDVFEERYLICSFIVLLLIAAFYIDRLDMSKLFSKLLCIGLLLSLFMNNIVSDATYHKENNSVFYVDEISEVVKSQDAGLIYVYGNNLSTLEFIVRVYDFDHVYKYVQENNAIYHSGDYLYYDDASEYSGPTLLIVHHRDNNLPDEVMEQYTLVQSINDRIDIYRADANPMADVIS